MAAAICDFEPREMTYRRGGSETVVDRFGKGQERLHRVDSANLYLEPSEKIIDKIKNRRPEVILVTFKTTSGESEAALVSKAKFNLVRSRSDIVLGNDTREKRNVLVAADDQVISLDSREQILSSLAEKILSLV